MPQDFFSSKIKVMRGVMLVALFLIVVLPLAAMNRDQDVASAIDNRKLQEAPKFEGDFDAFTDASENYFSDRIGFRYEMVGAYSLLNDRLFHLMVHPTYEYGDDGYVFLKFDNTAYDDYFVQTFATYIRQMQDYCKERDLPFLYVISPSKTRIYAEYIPDTIGELPSSAEKLKRALDRLDVNYIDLGEAVMKRKDEGVQVFNKVYDAGHWNNEGMYAGSQMIVDKLQDMGADVEDIDLAEYDTVTTKRTSLLASNYPIDEDTNSFVLKDGVPGGKVVEHYGDNLELHPNNKVFNYYLNDDVSTSSLLMMQGSYFNSQGVMLQNLFTRIAQVHDYENVLNLPYYVDVFQPDVVVFENADYTVNDMHYNLEDLETTVLPPAYRTVESLPAVDLGAGGALTYDPTSAVLNFTYVWEDPDISAVYVRIGDTVYDTLLQEGSAVHWGVDADAVKGHDEVEVIGVGDGVRYIYRVSIAAS